MTWMTVRGPRVNDSATATGMNIGDGRITVVLAIVLAVLGAGLLTGRMRKLGGTKVAAMGALVAGAAGVAVTADRHRRRRRSRDAPRRAARRGDECRERAVALLPRCVARGGRRAHGVREPRAHDAHLSDGAARRGATLAWSRRGVAAPGDVAQLARAPALQAGGRGFESHRLHPTRTGIPGHALPWPLA